MFNDFGNFRLFPPKSERKLFMDQGELNIGISKGNMKKLYMKKKRK